MKFLVGQIFMYVFIFTPIFTLDRTPGLGVVDGQCQALLRCSDCIRVPGCAWCKKPKFSEVENPRREYHRCNNIQTHHDLGICSEFLENPEYILKMYCEVGADDESVKHGGPKIHIAPSEAFLKLRVGEVVNVTMEYFDTENKPLDLYYIMDLSATMADDKSKVATLGAILAQRMSNLTSNVKIGFGSFIDKPITPFVSIHQLNKKETETTTVPYGFKNHLSLTTDIERFQEEVRKSKTSGNLDAPEGVLDAIIQSVVCTQVIGWRPNARHLLIVSTDGPFHIAGDAKLGGITKPNDGRCHMTLTTQGSIYSESANLDYPSIAQVNAKVKQEHVFVIFAVTEEHVPLYTKLSARILGSATRALEDDSENVVELVEQEYKKIITSIELSKLPPQLSPFLQLTYYAKCSNELPYVKGSKCHDMKVGSNATFQIELELLRCPKNKKDWKQTLQISPVGVAERLTLNLEMTCDCPCESMVDDGYQQSDPLCQSKGTPRCGICDCAEGFIGKNCQCSSKAGSIHDIDDSVCRPGNSSTACSNRGVCVCGQCLCNQNDQGLQAYSGTFCECDDTNCPVGDNGLVCSGQGSCKCSKCTCAVGFVGDSCSCTTDGEKCREIGDESTCSSRGYCKCGKCVCENPFSGRLCQNCPNCPGKCEDPSLLGCIQCFVQKVNDPQFRLCAECNFLSEIIDVDEVYEESDEDKSCTYIDPSYCETKYVYRYAPHDRNKIEVKVERRKRCSANVPIIWVVIGIVSSVIIGGLVLLLLWKFVTHYYDTKEWAKFNEDVRDGKWSEGVNPLYKEATSIYANPTYRRPSND